VVENKKNREKPSSVQPSSSSKQLLEWSYFSAASESKTKKECQSKFLNSSFVLCAEDANQSKQMRAKYTALLKGIQKLVGDEVPTDELHSAAFLAFQILGDETLEDAIKK
jgi:hypothetical protein